MNKKMTCAMVAGIIISAAAGITGVAAAEPAPLQFTQNNEGKYIYCNNPESVTTSYLADNSNPNAKFIMNNDNLSMDRYVMFVGLLNKTDYTNLAQPTGSKGFDIEADVLFRAESDTEITISRLGFDVPQHKTFFIDGVQYTEENDWGGFDGWASFMGLPIKQIDSGNVYEPSNFEPVTFTIKAGEEVWMSQFIENYSSVALRRYVHMFADFTINSGECDVNVAALRSTGTPKDRSNFNENAGYGTFIRDKQYKGISEGLNEVSADLSYTIDDSIANGSKLPVTVTNHYNPEGNTIDSWYTQLNPRADAWSYDVCAESDMLSFNYYDSYKKYLFGTESEDNDLTYHFDVNHNDRTVYDKSYGSAAKYEPNSLLAEGPPTADACNLANYGVIYNYNIEVKNDGYATRYLIYRLATSSNNLVWVKDSNGNIMNSRILAKGRNTTRVADDMACVPVPAQSSVKYTICNLLVSNYSGGMENSFVISDYQSIIETYESDRSGITKNPYYDGKEYYNWDGGTLNLSDDNKEWRKVALPQSVTNFIAGNYNEYRLTWTGDGYTLRPSLYDAGSFGFIDYMYRDMILMDKNFNLIEKHTFGSYPQAYTTANGVHYIKVGGTVYYSKGSFNNWILTNATMPCWNYGSFSVMSDNGVIKLSTDGINYNEVSYLGFSPEYIDEYEGYYYYIEGRTLYLSKDGIYWEHIVFNNKVKNFEVNGYEIVVNGTEAKELPSFKDTVAMIINDKYVSTENPSLSINNSPYIPLRETAQLLGYMVDYTDGIVSLTKGDNKTEITNGIMVGENMYAPLKILVLNLGCKVSYDSVNKVAVIQ